MRQKRCAFVHFILVQNYTGSHWISLYGEKKKAFYLFIFFCVRQKKEIPTDLNVITIEIIRLNEDE